MILDRLQNVFREIFDDDELQITKDTTADDIAAWDSLQHINLLFRVEAEFGVQFSGDEGSALANVGDLVNLLEGKRGSG